MLYKPPEPEGFGYPQGWVNRVTVISISIGALVGLLVPIVAQLPMVFYFFTIFTGIAFGIILVPTFGYRARR